MESCHDHTAPHPTLVRTLGGPAANLRTTLACHTPRAIITPRRCAARNHKRIAHTGLVQIPTDSSRQPMFGGVRRAPGGGHCGDGCGTPRAAGANVVAEATPCAGNGTHTKTRRARGPHAQVCGSRPRAQGNCTAHPSRALPEQVERGRLCARACGGQTQGGRAHWRHHATVYRALLWWRASAKRRRNDQHRVMSTVPCERAHQRGAPTEAIIAARQWRMRATAAVCVHTDTICGSHYFSGARRGECPADDGSALRGRRPASNPGRQHCDCASSPRGGGIDSRRHSVGNDREASARCGCM